MAIIVAFQLFARFSANVSMFISIFSHQILREKIGDLYINIINKKISSESHNSETSEIENINFLVSEMSLDICRNAGPSSCHRWS